MKDLHTANKRFACDRCRDQKLRCPRVDGNPELCTRCQRAGALCVTSSTRPIGRPSVDRSTPTAAARTRRLRERAPERDRDHREGTMPLPPLPQIPTGVSDLMTVNTQPIWPLGGDDYPPLDLLGSPRPAQYSPAENRGMDVWGPSDATSALFGLKLPDDFMLFPFTAGYQERFPAADPDAGLKSQPGRAGGDDLGTGFIATAARGAGAVSDPMEEDAEDREETDGERDASLTTPRTTDVIIALSRLNENITRHLSKLDSFQWQPPSVVGICAERVNGTADNPVAQVLQNTADFLAILKRVLSTVPPSPPPISETSASDSAFFSSADTCHSASSSAISSLPQRPRNMSVSERLSMKLDMPTLLLVLSNYLQLLRMYDSIFCHVKRSLGEMTDESFASFQAQARGISQQGPLRVGSFDISQGKLYVKVLVQVMEDQLESVQRLMGLPPQYRLSQRPGRGASSGIFSGIESSPGSALLRAAMDSNAEQGEDMGEGLIASLRDSIEQVRRAVED